MGLFTTLNPFYWRKRALLCKQSSDYAWEALEHFQAENTELKQRIKILSEPYQYPKPEALVGNITLAMVQPDGWKHNDAGEVLKTHTQKEAKLLLDNEMLKQQLEEYEKFYKELSMVAGSDVMEKVSNLKAKQHKAEKYAREYLLELVTTQSQLEKCEAELERSKAINEKWFETALGYSANYFTLLTKSFWGHKPSLVEFGNDKDS